MKNRAETPREIEECMTRPFITIDDWIASLVQLLIVLFVMTTLFMVLR